MTLRNVGGIAVVFGSRLVFCVSKRAPSAASRVGSPGIQAGIGVYERGADGLLAAARVYDDVEAPVEKP